MKTRLVSTVVLLLVSAGFLALGYSERSFGILLLGLAASLSALAVWLKPLRVVLTVTVSLVLSFSMVEMALGLLQKDSAETKYDSNSDYAKHYWSHTDIGAAPRPGVHGTRKLTTTGELIYEATYTIGEDRFRVTPGGGSTAGPRVNFLGCSMTFGEGLNDNQTLAAHVQRDLESIRVKNFGIHGYGMHQALAILQSDRNTEGRINFVLTAPWHAERSACVPSFALGSPRYRLLADGSVQRDGVCGGITYFPLAKLVSLSRVYSLISGALQPRKQQDAEIDLYLALIREMAALSSSRKQQLVVGFMKAPEKWFAGSYTNEKVQQKLLGMDLQLIDVTLAQREEELPAVYMLHKLDEHPTDAANQARAALVVPVLQRLLER